MAQQQTQSPVTRSAKNKGGKQLWRKMVKVSAAFVRSDRTESFWRKEITWSWTERSDCSTFTFEFDGCSTSFILLVPHRQVSVIGNGARRFFYV
mmetsp:Transcript_12028/g.29131  ORF Transcript_12028/g.29131 Transcript_12028/m.29131 type:complete len:94 (-) Transcript_12028:112-393(-)